MQALFGSMRGQCLKQNGVHGFVTRLRCASPGQACRTNAFFARGMQGRGGIPPPRAAAAVKSVKKNFLTNEKGCAIVIYEIFITIIHI